MPAAYGIEGIERCSGVDLIHDFTISRFHEDMGSVIYARIVIVTLYECTCMVYLLAGRLESPLRLRKVRLLLAGVPMGEELAGSHDVRTILGTFMTS